ncbi:hypothetical protein [Allomuricauda sp. d1]|uniref:hypothetical protein n=1 Tax=Allomuricauda sp. d1 TaxID=3136725 RepID=UPI0031DDFB65
MKNTSFHWKPFIIITLFTSIWINISEVFRYFLLVMPRTKAFFQGRAGVAEMDWGIFAIWAFWDTLLTAVLVLGFWLFAQVFGNTLKTATVSGTFIWASVFVIFWVATANMGLADWKILWITLPLSWLEMVVGAFIASKLYDQPRFA